MRRIGQSTIALFALQICVLALLVHSTDSVALKTDRNQPALINADEIEIDFKTGNRIYIGNVTIVQGSIRLNADKLIATFDGSKLQQATAYGNPAVFKQRPDDAEGDVVGQANTMIIDEVKQLITLTQNASLTQAGGATIASDNIIYDMTTEKLKASGGTTTKKPADKSSKAPTDSPATTNSATNSPSNGPSNSPSNSSGTNTGAVAAQSTPEPTAAKLAQVESAAKQADTAAPKAKATNGDQPTITSESGRMRVVIPPRKKPQS